MAGLGTQSDPYLISTPEDWNEWLQLIIKNTSSSNDYMYAELTNDIDFSITNFYIPTTYKEYSVYNIQLDGKGYCIKNAQINVPYYSNSMEVWRFFNGCCFRSNCTFSNLTIKNFSINSDYSIYIFRCENINTNYFYNVHFQSNFVTSKREFHYFYYCSCEKSSCSSNLQVRGFSIFYESKCINSYAKNIITYNGVSGNINGLYEFYRCQCFNCFSRSKFINWDDSSDSYSLVTFNFTNKSGLNCYAACTYENTGLNKKVMPLEDNKVNCFYDKTLCPDNYIKDNTILAYGVETSQLKSKAFLQSKGWVF